MKRWGPWGLALGLLLACKKSGPAAPVVTTPSPAPARPAEPAWTPERVNSFVVEVDQAAQKLAYEVASKIAKDPERKLLGSCYDEPAADLGPASAIVPQLEQRLTGAALDCYLATYFGCRVGDRIASAGVAQHGPGGAPFRGAKVTLVEASADQVVADVDEADYNDVLDGGRLNKDETGDMTSFGIHSRYTLSRDGAGTWRISDRKPSFKEWECRPR
jgi:hypothetical protein